MNNFIFKTRKGANHEAVMCLHMAASWPPTLKRPGLIVEKGLRVLAKILKISCL